MALFVAVLYVLLYAAVGFLLLYVIIWLAEQVFGIAIPARIKQLLYVIVLILVLLAIVTTVPFPSFPRLR